MASWGERVRGTSVHRGLHSPLAQARPAPSLNSHNSHNLATGDILEHTAAEAALSHNQLTCRGGKEWRGDVTDGVTGPQAQHSYCTPAGPLSTAYNESYRNNQNVADSYSNRFQIYVLIFLGCSAVRIAMQVNCVRVDTKNLDYATKKE